MEKIEENKESKISGEVFSVTRGEIQSLDDLTKLTVPANTALPEVKFCIFDDYL